MVSDCGYPQGEPFDDGPEVSLVDLGESNGALVQAVVYPRPDYEGRPWSQWGQGLVLPDGRFLSAIGDHVGADGNSYVYLFDPELGTLRMLGDLLSQVEHEPGEWGYGKVHAQMVSGPCGEVYLSSYWGSFRGLTFGDSYNGDYLFRLDPSTLTIAPLGVPVARHGVPSMAGSPEHGLLYGEAVDPTLKPERINEGPFFVFDVGTLDVVYEGPPAPHAGYRAILVDASGRAYYSLGDGEVAVYDPTSNEVTTHPHQLPGDWIRAVTPVLADGSVVGVTRTPETLFRMTPEGEFVDLGQARGYTTSLGLHPDEDRVFYVPEAHGRSFESGTPLVSVDIGSGEETVVAFLNDLAESELGLRLGGTYNVAVSPDGDKVYIGMNAGAVGADDTFGEVVLLVVHLP